MNSWSAGIVSCSATVKSGFRGSLTLPNSDFSHSRVNVNSSWRDGSLNGER